MGRGAGGWHQVQNKHAEGMDVLFQVQASKQGEGIGSTLGEWRGIRSGDCWVESTQGKQQCCS